MSQNGSVLFLVLIALHLVHEYLLTLLQYLCMIVFPFPVSIESSLGYLRMGAGGAGSYIIIIN